MSQLGVLSATYLLTYNTREERVGENTIENFNLDLERDLPGMETEAGNYARIGLTNLLDQMPIFLNGIIKMTMLKKIEQP